MPRNFFNVVVVRSIEATVEMVVEAEAADDAQDVALTHLRAREHAYEWNSPRQDLIVWHKREIAAPAIVDVRA